MNTAVVAPHQVASVESGAIVIPVDRRVQHAVDNDGEADELERHMAETEKFKHDAGSSPPTHPDWVDEASGMGDGAVVSKASFQDEFESPCWCDEGCCVRSRLCHCTGDDRCCWRMKSNGLQWICCGRHGVLVSSRHKDTMRKCWGFQLLGLFIVLFILFLTIGLLA